jgi:hypothetical protein
VYTVTTTGAGQNMSITETQTLRAANGQAYAQISDYYSVSGSFYTSILNIRSREWGEHFRTDMALENSVSPMNFEGMASPVAINKVVQRYYSYGGDGRLAQVDAITLSAQLAFGGSLPYQTLAALVNAIRGPVQTDRVYYYNTIEQVMGNAPINVLYVENYIVNDNEAYLSNTLTQFGAIGASGMGTSQFYMDAFNMTQRREYRYNNGLNDQIYVKQRVERLNTRQYANENSPDDVIFGEAYFLSHSERYNEALGVDGNHAGVHIDEELFNATLKVILQGGNNKHIEYTEVSTNMWLT